MIVVILTICKRGSTAPHTFAGCVTVTTTCTSGILTDATKIAVPVKHYGPSPSPQPLLPGVQFLPLWVDRLLFLRWSSSPEGSRDHLGVAPTARRLVQRPHPARVVTSVHLVTICVAWFCERPVRKETALPPGK